MKKARLLSKIVAALFGTLLLAPSSVWGCAVCFGKSDSAMADGMNFAIVSLLVVIGLVLGVVASFFVFLARRTSSRSAASELAAAENGAEFREHFAVGDSGATSSVKHKY